MFIKFLWKTVSLVKLIWSYISVFTKGGDNMYENISDAELGAKVKAAHIKHMERVEHLTPQ